MSGSRKSGWKGVELHAGPCAQPAIRDCWDNTASPSVVSVCLGKAARSMTVTVTRARDAASPDGADRYTEWYTDCGAVAACHRYVTVTREFVAEREVQAISDEKKYLQIQLLASIKFDLCDC